MTDRVRVYFNLHRRLFSVQRKVAGRWKVTQHTDALVLDDVRFIVSEAGRQRVLREGRKDVHAYVEGVPRTEDTDEVVRDGHAVTYNPRYAASFVTCGGGVRAARADTAYLFKLDLSEAARIHAINPRSN